MNKFLLLAAAAVLSTTATGYAAPQEEPKNSGQVSITLGGNNCAMLLRWTGAFYASRQSVTCSGGNSFFVTVGLRSKVKGIGDIILVPTEIAALEGNPSFGSSFVLSAPLKDGGTVIGYGTASSLSVYEFSVGNGKYHVKKGAHKANNPRTAPIQETLLKYANAHTE
jgi:hypothetical protein